MARVREGALSDVSLSLADKLPNCAHEPAHGTRPSMNDDTASTRPRSRNRSSMFRRTSPRRATALRGSWLES